MFGGVIQTSLKPVDGSDSMQNKDALTNEYYETGPGHFVSRHGVLIQDHLILDLMTVPDLHHNNIGSYALTLQCQHRYVGIVWGVLAFVGQETFRPVENYWNRNTNNMDDPMLFMVANLRMIIRCKKDADGRWSLIYVEPIEEGGPVHRELFACGDFRSRFFLNALEFCEGSCVVSRRFPSLGNVPSDVMHSLLR